MEDLNDKITGDALTAAEFVQPMSEIQNVIENLGIALSAGDLNQLGKAIAGYVANGNFYTDGGAANAYVLTKIGLKQTATAYTDGLEIAFIPDNTNTGASTVNVAGLGVKDLKLFGNDMPAGFIEAASTIAAKFDGTDFQLIPFEGKRDYVDVKSGRKNYIINGNFPLNQRVVSGTVVLSAGEYGHDRFRAGSGGCTYTFAISAGKTTLTITVGTLEQEIEGTFVESTSVILSWGGTAQGQISGGGFGSSGVEATAFGGANSTVEFNTGTLELVQLEDGFVITDFELRPIAEELILAERYFEVIELRSGQIASSGQAVSTTQASGAILWKTKKRGIPTVTYGTLDNSDSTGGNAGGVPTTNIASADGVDWTNATAAGLVAGNASYIENFTGSTTTITADSEL